MLKGSNFEMEFDFTIINIIADITLKHTIIDKIYKLQSLTKYLRLTLVFMWNNALRAKFNFCFFQGFFARVSGKLSRRKLPPDNCPPDNFPLDNCLPDYCPHKIAPKKENSPRTIASEENRPPDNCPQDDCSRKINPKDNCPLTISSWKLPASSFFSPRIRNRTTLIDSCFLLFSFFVV